MFSFRIRPVALALLMLLIAGCGGQPAAPQPKAAEPAKAPAAPAAAQPAAPAPAASDDPAVVAAAKKEGEVWFYSANRSTNDMLAKLWSEKYPQITLNIVRKSSQELESAVEAERAAKRLKVDVIAVAGTPVHARWAGEGFLLPYKPKGFDDLLPQFRPVPDGTYWFVYTVAVAGAYNPKGMKPEDVPKTWQEFLDPKYKGKLVMAHPGEGGSAFAAFYAVVNKYGWEYVQKLAKQDVLFVQGSANVMNMVLSGERPIAANIGSNTVYETIAQGKSVQIFYPSDVVGMNTPAVGILKEAPHPNAAKLVTDMLASEELQRLSAKEAYWSVHKDVPPPPSHPKLSDLKQAYYLDFAAAAKEQNAFVDKFKEVMGR